MPSVVVDASLVLKWVLPRDPLRKPALELGRRWEDGGVRVCAPDLLVCEAANALHKEVRAGSLNHQSAEAGLGLLLGYDFAFHPSETLAADALRISAQFGFGATYEAFYLALASRLESELWTADRKLFARVRPELPWIQLLSPTGTGD